MTRDPIPFEDMDKQDAYFSNLVGTDDLVAVGFEVEDRFTAWGKLRFPCCRSHFT